MSSKRIKLNTPAIYKISSRTPGDVFLFDTETKDDMRKDLGTTAGFCGVQVLTYSILDNHIHLLIKVQGTCTADANELLRRYGILNGEKKRYALAQKWKILRESNQLQLLQQEYKKLRTRMDDLSKFMKLLKQRWSQHFNKRKDRHGTIWNGTFKSSLVEPEEAVFPGAYIDLNAVRANIIESPEDYPWCGFAEAMGKFRRVIDGLDFRKGLLEMYQRPTDEMLGRQIALEHLERFFHVEKGLGDLPKGYWDKNGVLLRGGDLPIKLLLRCKVRYFTRGYIIGTKKFVNRVFLEHPEFFGPKRKTGARKIRGCKELAGILYVARDLRKDVIMLPRPP